MNAHVSNEEKTCHGGKPARKGCWKEKTGLVSQGMAEEAGEFE
jgi:hypothetical protein